MLAMYHPELRASILATAGILALTRLATAQSGRPGMGSIPYADASGTGVTFRVWAPDATSVTVPGSFNGWTPTANPFVKQPGASGLWSRHPPTVTPPIPPNPHKHFLHRSRRQPH